MIQTIATIIIPVFIIIALGYSATLFKFLEISEIQILTKFAQNIALPCLLFINLYKLDLNSVFSLNLLLTFYLSASISFVIGILIGYYFFLKNLANSIPIGFCCLFSNSLLLGLPITELALGTEALESNFIIVAFHAPFCYLLGISAMEISINGNKNLLIACKKILKSILSNALTVGIILGFLFNVSHIPIPYFLTDALNLLAKAGIPIALFALGGILTQYKEKLINSLPQSIMIACISLFIQPLLTVYFGKNIFTISEEELKSAVITAAMAPGVNAFIFSNMYKRSIEIDCKFSYFMYSNINIFKCILDYLYKLASKDNKVF